MLWEAEPWEEPTLILPPFRGCDFNDSLSSHREVKATLEVYELQVTEPTSYPEFPRILQAHDHKGNGPLVPILVYLSLGADCV